MSDKQEVKGKKTKEELQEYKEKLLVVIQDCFGSAISGMISPMEFMHMIPLLLSIVHAIFHELGERTWECETEDHSHVFKSLDHLYAAILEDRAENNDVVAWIDDPEKSEELQRLQEARMAAAMSEMEGVGSVKEEYSGTHLL